MSNVYEVVKDRLGMGKDSLEVLQEKTQRIAGLSKAIAMKVSGKKELSLSLDEVFDAAIITRTVHEDNEGIYNGKAPFDSMKNSIRSEYSLKVARERGVQLSEAQESVIKGDSGLIEEGIIKLAESIIAMQYKRIQRGVTKEAVSSPAEIISELLSDTRIDRNLVSEVIGVQELEQLVSTERGVGVTKDAKKDTSFER